MAAVLSTAAIFQTPSKTGGQLELASLGSSPKDPKIKFSVFSMVGRIVPSIIEVSI